MTYDYEEETKKNIREFIRENDFDPKDFETRDQMYEALLNACATDDGVTGVDSQSFTCDSAEAERNLMGNRDLLGDFMNEYYGNGPVSMWRKAALDSEWADMQIRCYVLGDALGAVLNEDYKDKDFGTGEDDE